MRPISAMGWMDPVSLLACMMVTRIVRGVMALLDVLWVHDPIPVNGQVGHAEATPFQIAAGFEHRRVLGLRGDDVVARVLPALRRPP